MRVNHPNGHFQNPIRLIFIGPIAGVQFIKSHGSPLVKPFGGVRIGVGGESGLHVGFVHLFGGLGGDSAQVFIARILGGFNQSEGSFSVVVRGKPAVSFAQIFRIGFFVIAVELTVILADAREAIEVPIEVVFYRTFGIGAEVINKAERYERLSSGFAVFSVGIV